MPKLPGEPTEDLAEELAVLGSLSRLSILLMLEAKGDCRVNEIATELNLSPAAASQHLAKMRGVGMVEGRREAQQRVYRLVHGPVVDAVLALAAAV